MFENGRAWERKLSIELLHCCFPASDFLRHSVLRCAVVWGATWELEAKVRRGAVRTGLRRADVGLRPFTAPAMQLHDEDISIARGKGGEMSVA